MARIDLEKGEREIYLREAYEAEEARRAYLKTPEGERETYLASLVAQGFCPMCEGMGDTGHEEESGARFVCYSCGGTGKRP